MIRIIQGDCRDVLRTLADASVQCCVTSPPYFGLRDYGAAAQIGLEATPSAYVGQLVAVFREVRRVLRIDGTLWLNLGDSYFSSGGATPGKRSAGIGQADAVDGPGERLKQKDIVGIPWRVAFALQADGWWLRQDLIWHKPNPMPESVRDRCTKAHEYIFLLSKSERYYFDGDAIAEQQTGGRMAVYYGTSGTHAYNAASGTHRDKSGSYGNGQTRNKRSVWTIATQPFADAHFATMPPALADLCIRAGCPIGGTVLDPFGGAGTTGLVADGLQRDAVLVELNPTYADMARRRITADAPLFASVT